MKSYQTKIAQTIRNGHGPNIMSQNIRHTNSNRENRHQKMRPQLVHSNDNDKSGDYGDSTNTEVVVGLQKMRGDIAHGGRQRPRHFTTQEKPHILQHMNCYAS